jgi:O-antigen ligase
VKFTKQQSNIVIGILFLITFIWVLRKPAVYFPDSSGYLDMHIIRTPGYPIFLKIIQSIFGNSFETALLFIQTAIGCFSTYFLIHKIRKVKLLNNVLYCCLSGVLLLPFLIGLRIGNNILSEAISYSLYLIIIGFYISFFISKNKKELLYAIPIIGLLLITRYQFIYLIPVGLAMIFWVGFKEKQWKQFTIPILLLLVLPVITSLIDRTYHKVVHDHFVSTPWTGMNIITPAFYVADEEDVAIFDSEQEKEFFAKTYAGLAEEKKNIHHLELAEGESKTLFYIYNYASITMGPIFKNGKAIVAETLSEDEKFIALEKMTANMSKPLILDNFTEWRRIYIGNMIFGFGGYNQFILYLFIALFSLIGIIKYNTKTYKILGLISILFISNIVLVAIGMHAVVRFTFYNDWVIFLTIFILLNSLNKKLYES